MNRTLQLVVLCYSFALTAQGGSLKKTYEALGLSRKALYEKMQKYGLSKEDMD